MKKWSEVLNDWENGIIPLMPINTNMKAMSPFIWRTSVMNNKKDLVYKEEFLEDHRLLNRNRQDLKSFSEHFNKAKNKNEKYSIHFPNLSKDTILVVPVPKKGKQFTNLFHFMKNASLKQQKDLWKNVAKQAKKMLKKNDNIWISSAGLGVNYLHIRICNYPKYYEKSKLKALPKNL